MDADLLTARNLTLNQVCTAVWPSQSWGNWGRRIESLRSAWSVQVELFSTPTRVWVGKNLPSILEAPCLILRGEIRRYVYLSMDTCVYSYTLLHICTHLHIWLHTYKFTMCVYPHTYIYTYIYAKYTQAFLYAHLWIYICMLLARHMQTRDVRTVHTVVLSVCRVEHFLLLVLISVSPDQTRAGV